MFESELLSPVGTLENTRYAFAYGADAIYAGRSRYSLRMHSNEFNHKNLQLGIDEAHAPGREFYVVVNIAPHNAKLKTFIRDLKPVVEMGPDALIMSDLGLIMLVREHLPEMPIHLSVQTNAVNWAMVKFWQQMGLTCVILSRELSLEEIGKTRNQVPDMEIGILVHGVPCMICFGRCLLSGYINKRSPNQGTCTNARRWEHNVQEGKEDDASDIVHKYEPIPVQDVELALGIDMPTDKVFMIEEAQRPGEYMTVFEDEYGTHIMNSKDLRAIAHVGYLIKMGVHSLKIESHTKPFYYCACTAQAYRKAIDDAAAGKPFDTNLLETLEGPAYRGCTEGLLRRYTHDDYQNCEYGYSVSDRQQFVGEPAGERESDLMAIAVKNKLFIGNSFELMAPQGNTNFTLKHMENARGEAMPAAPDGGYTAWIPMSQGLELDYALLMRNFSGEAMRNPHGK